MTLSEAKVSNGANYRNLYRKSVAESLKAQQKLDKAREMIREQKSYVITMGAYADALEEENKQLKEEIELEKDRKNTWGAVITSFFVAVILIVLYLGGR